MRYAWIVIPAQNGTQWRPRTDVVPSYDLAHRMAHTKINKGIGAVIGDQSAGGGKGIFTLHLCGGGICINDPQGQPQPRAAEPDRPSIRARGHDAG